MGSNLARCKDNFSNYNDESFEARYTTSLFPHALGSGQFSKAYRCWKRGSSRHYALKAFAAEPGAADHAVNEIRVLRALGKHPRITGLIDWDIEDVYAVRVVLELCEGGQLYDRIMQKGAYEESEAATVIRYVLDAVCYMHSKGTMHRDLKPENVLLVRRDSDTEIKVCDFGLAKMAASPSQLPRSCSFTGSDLYLAPEMIRQIEYGREVDIWAMGVLSYCVLSGQLPFCSDDPVATYRRICNRELSFDGEAWESISAIAVEFIAHMLSIQPIARPTAAAALEHKWLEFHAASSDEDEEDEDGDCEDDDEEEAEGEEEDEPDVREHDATSPDINVVETSNRSRCTNC